jgi:hypothetical protein
MFVPTVDDSSRTDGESFADFVGDFPVVAQTSAGSHYIYSIISGVVTRMRCATEES